MAISNRTKEFLVAALADRKAAEELVEIIEALVAAVAALEEPEENPEDGD